MLIALAALVSTASVETAINPWEKIKIKAGEPAPYLRKERGKAQWKTERKGRK